MSFYPSQSMTHGSCIGADKVPVKAWRNVAGLKSAPQEECEVPMTNPQPQRHPAEPLTSAAPALRLIPSAEAQVNATLHDEIRLLRERGLSDECIHGLFSGFNIEARPEAASHHWSLPLNSQLIGLIWGRASSKPITLD